MTNCFSFTVENVKEKGGRRWVLFWPSSRFDLVPSTCRPPYSAEAPAPEAVEGRQPGSQLHGLSQCSLSSEFPHGPGMARGDPYRDSGSALGVGVNLSIDGQVSFPLGRLCSWNGRLLNKEVIKQVRQYCLASEMPWV